MVVKYVVYNFRDKRGCHELRTPQPGEMPPPLLSPHLDQHGAPGGHQASLEHHLIITWSSLEHYLSIIWSWLEHHLIITWESLGHHLSITWSTLDHHLIITWASHYHHLINTWALLEHHLIITWSSLDHHMICLLLCLNYINSQCYKSDASMIYNAITPETNTITWVIKWWFSRILRCT